jgi:hypothetical protein
VLLFSLKQFYLPRSLNKIRSLQCFSQWNDLNESPNCHQQEVTVLVVNWVVPYAHHNFGEITNKAKWMILTSHLGHWTVITFAMRLTTDSYLHINIYRDPAYSKMIPATAVSHWLLSAEMLNCCWRLPQLCLLFANAYLQVMLKATICSIILQSLIYAKTILKGVIRLIKQCHNITAYSALFFPYI